MGEKIKKEDFQKLKRGSVDYVILHGRYRLQNGKKVSAILAHPFNVRNPLKALTLAMEMKTKKPRRSVSDIYRKYERLMPGIIEWCGWKP